MPLNGAQTSFASTVETLNEGPLRRDSDELQSQSYGCDPFFGLWPGVTHYRPRHVTNRPLRVDSKRTTMASDQGKRRLLLFVVSWAVLFAVTMLIRRIGMDEAEASAQSSTELYKRVLQQVQAAQLASIPRTTNSTHREVRDFPQLEETLHQNLLSSADEIQACVKKTMDRSESGTEKFEVSFRTTLSDGSIRLIDLLWEKSIANFDANEIGCLLRVISKVSLRSKAEIPDTNIRLTYPMCINKRS